LFHFGGSVESAPVTDLRHGTSRSTENRFGLKSLLKFGAAGTWLLLLTGVAQAQINTTNFFNWETAPVHPIALSPDSSKLAVCNLPDNRIEMFDVTSGSLSPLGSIPVGLDPVTVRFRTASEIWVANYISDSISIIDVPTTRVLSTITTSNEPSDIVFAGTPQRAYVSCGQPNLVQVFNVSTLQVVTNLAIDGNRPRAIDVSPDGLKVYVAIFESGNASTIIGSGVSAGLPKPSPINFPDAPADGLNPPPNSGTNFSPAINPAITNPPPRVSLIVKRNAARRWMDDNHGDWTEYIRGTNAAFTGRLPGWDIPDHDLAVINTANFGITYATGLMNICMAVAVNPGSGKVAVAGTDAINNIRFQPVLNGIFIRVELAQVDPASLSNSVVDLNPHLTYQVPQVSQTERNKSLGDPRGIIWNSAGSRGYVTGMGSDNIVVVDANGARAGLNPAIQVDTNAGPTGLALDETRHRLYVYNRFGGTISTVDTTTETVLNTRPLFDPTPQVIKAGRPHLYNTHQTSGLGQAACGSCHVDSRFDRLAWDLGDPTDVMKIIATNVNFLSSAPPPDPTNNFHPMKGPMTTQTLQDIIGHEPFHWRGDRDGLENFDTTFTNLQGAANGLSTNEMQDFKNFLGTVRFAPNRFRPLDNSLPTSVPLKGFFALGRGILPAGSQLPNGNAQSGQNDFRLSTSQGCIVCHTLPAGLGTDMKFPLNQWLPIPLGTNSAHHIALIQLERSAELPFKIPQLRNMFDKLGFDLGHTNSRAGFGFFHDGSVDSPVRIIQDGFGVTSDQATADLMSFLVCFSGSDLIPGNPFDINRSPGVASLDTPAAVGRQVTVSNSTSVPLLTTMIALANSSTSRVDVVAKGFKDGLPRGWFFDRTTGNFQSDRQAEVFSPAALQALAEPGSEQTYTVVPRGTGRRIGIDRDADGYLDRDELDFGSDPANPLSLATNTPPHLSAIPDLLLLKGRSVSLVLSAVDTDIPAQQLTFSLGTNAPPGASVDATNGIFTWTASGPSGPITNSITIIVTDNGKPNRSDSKTFNVVSVDLTVSQLTIGTNGTTLRWTGIAGLFYRLQFKNNLSDPVWLDLPGDVFATNATASKLDSSLSTNVTRFYRIVALP
jgi:YVTN family beta-propeller protein